MRKPTTILVALLLSTVVVLSAARHQESSPQQVVENYCESASAGDSEQVVKYATRYPRHFWDSEMNEIREQGGGESRAAAVSERPSGTVGVYRIARPDEDDSYMTFIKRTFPQGLSKYPDSKQVLKGISGVWVKGNEARVRAVIGYEDITNHRFEWEFYLYKEEAQGWKIFWISTPRQKERYAAPDDAAATNN